MNSHIPRGHREIPSVAQGWQLRFYFGGLIDFREKEERRERGAEGGREKHQFVVPLIDAFMG